MKRLNIFIDETGEFRFEEGSSELYGISFTFHDQKDNITPDFFEKSEIRKIIKALGKKRL